MDKKNILFIIVIIVFICIIFMISRKNNKANENNNIENVSNIVEKKINPYITNDMDEETRKFYEENPDFYTGFEDLGFSRPNITNIVPIDN